jgi:pyruvate,water dikinase
MSGSQRFPFFHEAGVPDGAQGWERMYPYYLVPQQEGRALEDSRFWFADTMHWSRCVHPFDSIGVEAVYLAAGQNSTRIFVLPTALGLDVRVVNGYVYICPIAVTDPDEIAERVKHFQERGGFYYQNWEQLYGRWKEKMLAAVGAMKELTFSPLDDLDPIEVVTEGRGRSASWELIANYHRLIDDFFLVWQYHFEMLNLGYGGYIVFFQFCKQAFPEIAEQAIARMVAGVDVLAFRPDDELRKLAMLAVELDIADIVAADVPPDEVIGRLRETNAGDKWLEALDAARDPWFNYFAEYGFLHDQDTWITDPAIPFKGISRYVRMLQEGRPIARPVERLRAERDEIVAEYRALLTPEEAPQFDELLGLARTVFPYIEEHNIYVEHWTHSVFWDKVRELSGALVAAGFFDDPEDLFYLNRFEIDQVLFDVVESWAIGVPPRGSQRWRAEVADRRSIMAALRAQPAPPAFGVPPAEITDPFAIMNYGVTTERVADWLGQSTSDGASLRGIPGSPGVVDGVVRVLRSEHDLPQLEQDEILVCQITAPSWASAFSVAAGVVTDIGGMMSHAAIVCREYGLPAVVGTGFATSKLATGQRIRVDGHAGTITVLDG